MKPHTIVTMLFIIAVATLVLAAPAIASKNQGRDQMVLDGGRTGPVPFKHHLHQDVVQDCQACHKDFKQEKGALDAAKAAGTLKKKQVMNKTCIACHRAKKKAGQTYGPVSCRACHKKE
jgi:cytochrome c5